MRSAPRWDDPAWWRAYWDDVRPRLLWLRIDAERVRLRWVCPMWALEESLRAVLLVGPWVVWFVRHLPLPLRWKTRRSFRRGRFDLDLDLGGAPGRAPWAAGRALLEGAGEGMLRLPSGVPFVHVEAGRDVRIEIVSL